MKKLHYALALFALLITLQLDAQDKRPIHDWFYLDAKLGPNFVPESISFYADVSVGYRINNRHAVGVSRRFNAIVDYSQTDYTTYALEYRYATENGFIAKARAGFVGGANFYPLNDGPDDALEVYNHTGSGFHYDLSLDYQLRFGLTLGVTYGLTSNVGFDHYMGTTPNGGMTYRGTDVRNYSTYGISLGLALPWRIRKKRSDD